jgi:hypothetical protein
MHLDLSFAINEEGEEYDDVDIVNDQSSLLEVVENAHQSYASSVSILVYGRCVHPRDHYTMILTLPRIADQQGFHKGSTGEWIRTVSLGQYERLEIPEAFLVVR